MTNAVRDESEGGRKTKSKQACISKQVLNRKVVQRGGTCKNQSG